MDVQPCQSHRDRRSACLGNSAVVETRKLAAILVSDVVGYSRLTGADEDRILARLRALRSDLIEPTISVHHGRIVAWRRGLVALGLTRSELPDPNNRGTVREL